MISYFAKLGIYAATTAGILAIVGALVAGVAMLIRAAAKKNKDGEQKPGNKKVGVAMICIMVVVTLVLSAGPIYFVTAKEAEWAESFGNIAQHSISSHAQTSKDLLEEHFRFSKDMREEQRQHSKEIFDRHSDYPDGSVGNHIQQSQKRIEEHIQKSRERIEQHVQESQERFR